MIDRHNVAFFNTERTLASGEYDHRLIISSMALPLSRIRTSRYNPRRYLDPAKVAELVAGVRGATAHHALIIAHSIGDDLLPDGVLIDDDIRKGG